jgi:hypothetical protein
VVATVDSIVSTVTGITANAFQGVGIKAIGTAISVFLNGLKVIDTSSADNLTGNTFRFSAYDSVADTAQADLQYLAIKPL